MDSQEFAEKIKKYIVDENLSIYQELFLNTKIEDVKDEYWKKAQLFFNSLPEEKKEIFFDITHQIMVDTVSNFLGIFDGTCEFGEDDYSLKINDKHISLDGSLQDYFLSLVEQKKK